MRERLIELLAKANQVCEEHYCYECRYNDEDNCKKRLYADYLLDNGVIVLPDDRFYKLRGLILDVNTAEIGSQIADDNLGSWTCSWRESAEKLIRDLYTHDREKTVSELAELKGTEE